MHIVWNNITALLITSKYLQNKTTSWHDRLYLFLIFITEKYIDWNRRPTQGLLFNVRALY